MFFGSVRKKTRRKKKVGLNSTEQKKRQEIAMENFQRLTEECGGEIRGGAEA